MDNITTIKELKAKVEAFCEARDWRQYHNPKDLAIGISTEANELLSIFRFKDNNEMTEMFEKINKREEIQDEVAEGWFVPSKEEWSTLGYNLGITYSNYGNYNLSEYCWSSSLEDDNHAWYARFMSGHMDEYKFNQLRHCASECDFLIL